MQRHQPRADQLCLPPVAVAASHDAGLCCRCSEPTSCTPIGGCYCLVPGTSSNTSTHMVVSGAALLARCTGPDQEKLASRLCRRRRRLCFVGAKRVLAYPASGNS